MLWYNCTHPIVKQYNNQHLDVVPGELVKFMIHQDYSTILQLYSLDVNLYNIKSCGMRAMKQVAGKTRQVTKSNPHRAVFVATESRMNTSGVALVSSQMRDPLHFYESQQDIKSSPSTVKCRMTATSVLVIYHFEAGGKILSVSRQSHAITRIQKCIPITSCCSGFMLNLGSFPMISLLCLPTPLSNSRYSLPIMLTEQPL